MDQYPQQNSLRRIPENSSNFSSDGVAVAAEHGASLYESNSSDDDSSGRGVSGRHNSTLYSEHPEGYSDHPDGLCRSSALYSEHEGAGNIIDQLSTSKTDEKWEAREYNTGSGAAAGISSGANSLRSGPRSTTSTARRHSLTENERIESMNKRPRELAASSSSLRSSITTTRRPTVSDEHRLFLQGLNPRRASDMNDQDEDGREGRDGFNVRAAFEKEHKGEFGLRKKLLDDSVGGS